MKDLLLHPLFSLGIFIRLALILAIIPTAEMLWYLPFLDATTAHFTLDPWRVFLASGGTPAAFPYGYVMWLAFLPLTFFSKIAGLPLHYGYQLTLLAADIGLLAVLRLMLPATKSRTLLATYWLSPIVLLATYFLGMNDLIPVLLLTLALYSTKHLRLLHAGAFCGAAVSAKLSMILAVPFFIIYLLRNNAMRKLLERYILGLLSVFVIFCLPFALWSAGPSMLVRNPEMGKAYQFMLSVGEHTVIYVLPLIYLLMLYMAWRVQRLNFHLFNILFGLSFLLVVLLTSAAPGWYIWVMPLLVFYQASGGKKAMVLVAAFSLLYLMIHIWFAPGAMAGEGMSRFLSDPTTITKLTSLLHTALTAVGIVLALRIWQEAISANDYFRLSRRPFVIGIAGDSGSGKNTLASALEGIFGSHSTVHVSGDNYHLWDRQNPMWQVMTHLNPMANDLASFASDVVRLANGEAIFSRHYNHETGKMSHPRRIKSNNFILASGLHALYLPVLRECYNLSIYLDIDEELRRYLKIKRDRDERGHSLERILTSLEKREPDSQTFIRPQAQHADLIFKLQPIHPRLPAQNSNESPHLGLIASSQSGLNEMSLARALIGICGLHVDITVNDIPFASEGWGDAPPDPPSLARRALRDDTQILKRFGYNNTGMALRIEGDPTAEDIAMAAAMIVPRILDFLDTQPKWQSGVTGLMQLITLAHIDQTLNRRML